MKCLLAFILLSLGFLPVFGQNEQSPIVEKAFDYKDWTYKNIRNDGSTNLREFTKGKKLVLVVYFAPWCPNWKHDVAFVQGLYDKYRSNGLEIIGVGEYDPVPSMKTHLDAYKITFPSVYESDSRPRWTRPYILPSVAKRATLGNGARRGMCSWNPHRSKKQATFW